MKPLAVLTLALFLAAPVQGSSFCYVGIPEVPEAYAKARAVFIGEVIKIDRPVTVDMGAPIADRLFRVTFKVEYSWKGAGFQELGLPEVVVLSDQNQAGRCWSWGVFLEGRKYLVYANETSDKNLIVGVGNRTAYLGKASEDLEKLRKLNALLTLRPIRRATLNVREH